MNKTKTIAFLDVANKGYIVTGFDDRAPQWTKTKQRVDGDFIFMENDTDKVLTSPDGEKLRWIDDAAALVAAFHAAVPADHHFLDEAEFRAMVADMTPERVFKNAEGATVDMPAGFEKRTYLAVDGESIESPVYEPHKRGSNWASLCTGKNAANMHRQFLPMRGRIIDTSALSVGSVIEIAGDYTSSGGNKSADRLPAIVVAISEDEIVLDVYSSIAKAMSAGNKGIRSTMVPKKAPKSAPALSQASLEAARKLADALDAGGKGGIISAIRGVAQTADNYGDEFNAVIDEVGRMTRAA